MSRAKTPAAVEPTPGSLGYPMPAAWEPHQSTWLAWPHNRSDWPGKFDAIPWVFADIVRHLARHEDVNLIVASAREKQTAQEVLKRSHVDSARVKYHVWPTNRIWTRDSGPIFIKNQQGVAVTNWRFNAWAKYGDWKHDNRLPDRIGKKLKLQQSTPMIDRNGRPLPVVLEGGSIDVNGQGLMLTTEECLLSKVQQRNPHLTRGDYERVFAELLGAPKVLWLGRGIAGDDTHGHVDDLARFVGPRTVVLVQEDD